MACSPAAARAAVVHSPKRAPSRTRFFDFAWTPFFREEWFAGAVKAQDGEPTLARPKLVCIQLPRSTSGEPQAISDFRSVGTWRTREVRPVPGPQRSLGVAGTGRTGMVGGVAWTQTAVLDSLA